MRKNNPDSLKSCPSSQVFRLNFASDFFNLLLVRFHQAEIIFFFFLFQATLLQLGIFVVVKNMHHRDDLVEHRTREASFGAQYTNHSANSMCTKQIVVKHLIQRRNNETRVGVEPSTLRSWRAKTMLRTTRPRCR